MTWILKNTKQFPNSLKVSKYINQSDIELFKETTFISNEFKNYTTGARYLNLPAVLDRRWEGFNNSSIDNFDTDVYVIHLSILMTSDISTVTIKLYIKTEPTETYQAEVNQLTNETQFARKIINETPFKGTAEINNQSFGKWYHYSIYSPNSDTYILKKLSKDGNGYQKSLKRFSITKLQVINNNIENVIWKLHDYQFLRIPPLIATPLFIEGIRIKNKTVCISFYVFTEESCMVIIQLCPNLSSDCKSKEYSTDGKWMEVNISDDFQNKENVKVHLSITLRQNCFAAIDDIRHCSTNESRILELNWDGNSDVGCASLLDQDAIVSYNTSEKYIPNISNIGSIISCEYIKTGMDCNKHVVCNEETCLCLAGYTGKYCNSNPNINMTIANVTATSGLFSVVGAENYNKTEFKCTVVIPLNEQDNIREFEISNNSLLVYGLIPNTKHELLCKSCISTKCNAYKKITEFTTINCTDFTQNNIQRNITADSITLNITDLQYFHCPAILYELHSNGSKIMGLENVTQIPTLDPFTNYEFEVIRKDNSNTTNKPIRFNVKTDYLAPEIPSDLTQNDSCFKVSPPKQNTSITGYSFTQKIQSRNCISLGITLINNVTMQTNSTEICIKHLIPYSKYKMETRACNNKGRSNKAKSITFETEPHGEIVNDELLVNVSIVGNETRILLPECNKTRGPLFYHVQSKCLEEWCRDEDTRSEVINYVNKTKFEEFIESLVPFSMHKMNITISRNNISIDGGRELNINISTPPSKPKPGSELAPYSLEHEKIFIRWKTGYPPTGEIESFTIYYCRHENNTNNDSGCSNTTEYKTCNIWHDYMCAELNGFKGLTYKIMVLQKNKYINTQSNFSTVIKVDGRAKPPKNFTATNTINCDIILKWLHPGFTNGNIRYFNVTMIDTKSGKPLSVSIREDLKQLYEHKLTDLTASKYKIYIQAYDESEGEISETLTVTVCSKYSEAPKNATLEWFFNLCITIVFIIIICVIILLYMKFRKRKFRELPAEEILLISSSRPIKKIDLKDLLSNFLDESGVNIFEKEFQDFDSPIELSQIIGSIPENRLKNRFRNIIPFDQSRVILGDISELDYINASYIQGHRGHNVYIATQCPKTETVYDFWCMIWQENVKIIVCLATLAEGENKMFQYWPDDYIHIQYNDFLINHKSNYTETDFVVRYLEVCRGNKRRSVLQLNYISWPDQSIPLFPISFLKYLKYAQDLQNSDTGPIVVHCSAGIGRTGTYIMCDNLISIDEDEVDVVDYLKEIRTYRPLLVSRVSQYMLIYFILDEHQNGKNTAIERRDIFEMLQEDVDETLTKHYNYIFERQYAHDMLHFVSVNMASEMPTTFVDGYQGERKFVTVELQPRNFNNIWWTIEQNAIKTVFILQETQGVNMFWPSDIPEKRVESFTIKHDKVTDFSDVIIYNLKYSKSGNTETVQIIYYMNWKINAPQPNNIKSFHDLYTYYRNLSSEENQTVMLCCHNGSTASGLFITMDLVIKKLETDQVFDICWAVLGIRPHNKAFMDEFEQYKFVFKMVKYYLKHGMQLNPEYQNTPGSVSIYQNI